MPYRLDIPGQVTEYQLKAIEAVASLAPKNGIVVEVGSLFGRSSYGWAKSVDQSVTVYCIDPWSTGGAPHSMAVQLGVDYSLEQFKKHVAGCDNIKPVVGYSPKDFSDWSEKVDIFYDDAVHTNPGFRQNIDFWAQHLKPSSVVCGDDYRFRFPDVVVESERLAERLGRRIIVVDNFWCALPDESDCPGATQVASLLLDLEREAQGARAALPTRLSVAWANPPVEVSKGAMLTLRGEIMYAGARSAFPSNASEATPLELVAVVRSRDTRVTVVSNLGVDFLYHEAPITIVVDVPTRALKAGRAAVDLRLKTPDGVFVVGGPLSLDITGSASAASAPLVSRHRLKGVYALGSRIDFSVSGMGAEYTAKGWDVPSGQYTWASGDEGLLTLVPLPTGATDFLPPQLRLEADVIVAPDAQGVAERKLAIVVNGVQIWSDRRKASSLVSAAIPREVWLSRRPVEIALMQIDDRPGVQIATEGHFAGLRSLKVTI